MTQQTRDAQTIRILPPQLVNRIAAGEVVERPASVVKELVENALDAGALRVDISLSNGGRTLRVADDGSGMTADNARLAFYNHATSKIANDEDLHRIATFGFRGEALASISAVSRVSCLTRTADALTGLRVTVSELGESILTEAGCAPGTVMEVADLFYNTPARLKFLKKPQTELAQAEETVQSLALSNPDVRFTLTINEQNVFKTTGGGDVLSVLVALYRVRSEQERSGLIPIHFEDPSLGMAITGYAASPATDSLHKGNKKVWHTFVNRRAIRCSVMSRAIESAYESLIPSGRYPVCALFLTLQPEEVDVNVHPTKKEVRYAQPNAVFSLVRHGIRQALEAHCHDVLFRGSPPAQSLSLDGTFPATKTSESVSAFPADSPPRSISVDSPGVSHLSHFSPREPDKTPERVAAAISLFEHPSAFGAPSNTALIEVALPALPQNDDSPAPIRRLPDGGPEWRVIGQLFNTYILMETRQGLMVVDQHIASERALFERISRRIDSESTEIQPLLLPETLSLAPTQRVIATEHQAALEKLGFRFVVEDETLTLHGFPLIYPERQSDPPLRQLLSLLEQIEATGQASLPLGDLVATLACHSAVRAGDVLNTDQMNRVIEAWLASTLPWTCPHGRPIAHTIQTEDLHRFFHRGSLPVNAGG